MPSKFAMICLGLIGLIGCGPVEPTPRQQHSYQMQQRCLDLGGVPILNYNSMRLTDCKFPCGEADAQ
jgi:hypothetical protein